MNLNIEHLNRLVAESLCCVEMSAGQELEFLLHIVEVQPIRNGERNQLGTGRLNCNFAALTLLHFELQMRLGIRREIR